MNDKTNNSLSFKVMTCNRSRYPYLRNRQGGALLIGLIITMVIFGALGGAMVYFISSSAMDSVYGYFAQRAYYAAESGMRYAAAAYRKTGDDTIGRINFLGLDGRTLSFPNNGQAILAINPSPSPAADVVATVVIAGGVPKQIVLGGDLTINDASQFPEKSGFFKIGTDTVYYRYRTRDLVTNTLYGITGPGLSPTAGPTVTNGTIITATKGQYSITSTGYFPSTGIGLFRRTVEYGWILSGIPPPAPIGGGPQLPKNFQEIVDNNPFKGTALGEFAVADVGGPAITVTNITGGAAEAVLGYVTTPNPFQIAWINADKYLSYDIQIKIGTGVWTSGAFDKTLGGSNGQSVRDNGYIAGLTFRSTGNTPGLWNQLGVDFAKYNKSSDGSFPANLRIYPDLIKKTDYIKDYIGWDPKPGYNGFFKCNAATCNYSAAGARDANWISYDPPPMILLWIRFGNATSAEDYWLAYMQLHQNSDSTKNEPNDGIVDASGFLKDWSTIMLRVVEGASLQFGTTTDSTTGFLVGDIVTEEGSGAKGKVIKKIQTIDGKDVIILNNVTGTFTPAGGKNISAPGRLTTVSVSYRQRDNYIWAMFGDTSPHEPVDDKSASNGAINDKRGANARIATAAEHDNINAANMNCYVHWPETNIADWGTPIVENCPTPQTVPNDYFKLVRWDALHTNQTGWAAPVSMLIMGTGKEAGAILRTDKWTTGLYPTPFPYEIGFHSVGTSATKTYFDDLAINFPGQTTAGGIEYVPYVQQ